MTSNAANAALSDTVSSHAAYDETPYVSHAFPQTNPLLLQGIAKLFGLTAPDPQHARILEIGCASGGNIMSVANNFPESQCVGIDYSKRQIEVGNADKAAAGIANLELKHLSVMDVTKDFGTFDYIICHGVLSWVPAEVQDKILEVCANNLSQDGVAFISYNTLPGWNHVRSVRDMMLYHTSRFADAPTKANQARQLLKFVGDAMKANSNPMAALLEQEFKLLSPHPDSYLLHDHMEENNFPFYFHELMERAGGKGLQYLADASLETMYSGNLPPEFAEVLATSNDLVRTEQYMDYISNRRFRNTLLCHKDRILSRNLQPDMLRDGLVRSYFTYPEGFAQHDITSRAQLQFKSPNNMTLTSDDTVNQAMLQVLMEHKTMPVRVADITAQVRAKLTNVKYAGEEQALESRICSWLMRYVFIGAIGYLVQNFPCATSVSKKPAISKLARLQAAKQNWVSGKRQESLTLEAFDNVLIPFVDGTNDADALLKLILPHFASNQLTLNENGVPITDESVLKEKLVPVIANKLQRYAEIGLLEK